eukprot:Clim_evm19s172 gene=Clim_evmTU19s172
MTFCRLLLLTDIQYADKDGENDRYRTAWPRLQTTINQFNDLGIQVDMAIHLGDIIDGYEPKSSENKDRALHDMNNVLGQLGNLNCPRLFHVLGNHDLLNLERTSIYETLSIPCKSDSPAYYSAGPLANGVRVIILDTMHHNVHGWPVGHPNYIEAQAWLAENPEASHSYDWNGAVGKEQIDWLRREIEESQSKGELVIVMGHIPLLAQAADEKHLVYNGREVADLLDEYSTTVLAYFAGHYHLSGSTLPPCHNGSVAKGSELDGKVPCLHEPVEVLKERPASVPHITLKGHLDLGPDTSKYAFAIVEVSQAGMLNIMGHGEQASYKAVPAPKKDKDPRL